MTQVHAQPQHVVIFDKPSNDHSGLGIRERIAACYRFARCNGWQVTAVCDTSGRTSRAELERAVAICARTGAGLLVYRAELINRGCLGSTLVLNACAMPGSAAS